MRDGGSDGFDVDAVLAFLDLCDELGVGVWVDGGWGVDALLGEQTRPHDDLDVALEARHLDTLVDALHARHWRPVPRDDTSEWNFVLGDARDHRVDLHVIVLDARGDGVMGPPELGLRYPARSLSGTGVIAGRPVRCIEASSMVQFHTGYAVDEDDWADVRALCTRFGIPIPDDYAAWRDRT